MQSKSASDVKIIDVSHHQGAIDWVDVAADAVKGAFIKATEGTGYIDPQFKRNAACAAAVQLPVGFYHYAHPELNTAAEEAAHFLEMVKGMKSDFPLVLDVEGDASDIGGNELTAWCLDWLETVKKSGHAVMIYTGASFAKTYLGYSNHKLGAYPLWIAHYGVDTPMNNSTWLRWSMFQYTSSGRVDGIIGRVDVNAMDRTFFDQCTKGEVEMAKVLPTIYKDRIRAEGGKLKYIPIATTVDRATAYSKPGTDVRLIKFDRTRTRFGFVSEKGDKVTNIAKREGADFGFNFPFFDLKAQIVVGTVWDGTKYINGAYGDMRDWYEIGFLNGGAHIGKFTKSEREAMDFSVQGKILIADGKPVYKNDGQRCQRTFIGLDAVGNVMLVVADGRTGDDDGLTCEEMALYMQKNGAVWAIEGDGGGSSILYSATGGTYSPGDRTYSAGGINQSLNTGANERTVHHAVLVWIEDAQPQEPAYKDSDPITYGDLRKLGLIK